MRKSDRLIKHDAEQVRALENRRRRRHRAVLAIPVLWVASIVVARWLLGLS